jgi:putative ABC transport system ATP-binding protein
MTNPAVELRDVDLSLGRGAARVHILRKVSLTIGRGEAVGLVGASGSGKSTLLMTMAGLERPDSGSIFIDGVAIHEMSEDALARFRGARIGIVFQSFQLIPTMTALENVAAPLELAGAPDAFARASAELAAVGLAERLSHYPAQLSGGEQQRVAIARSLITRPAIVLADEPTGNLDTKNSDIVLEMLQRSNREFKQTVLMITHNPEAAAIADSILHMRDGSITGIESGKGAVAHQW